MKVIYHLKLSFLMIVKQMNSFFDNKSLELHDKNITLRTRFSNGVRELTLKQDLNGHRLETNYSPLLDKEFADLIVDGVIPPGSAILKELERLNLKEPYTYVGEMLNFRIEIPYEGCKLAIDHSQYLAKEDYQLEVEQDSDDADPKQVLKDLLKKLDIPYLKIKGKRKRFFEASVAQKIQAL